MTVPPREVELVEVAPRDGFQAIAQPIPTATKIGIIEALITAGCRRLEIGSFVSPKAVPQMADMAAIAARLRNRPGLRLAALVPNRKGAALALEQGVRELVYVFSASEAHNQANVRREIAQSLDELRGIVALAPAGGGPRLRVDIATAFDCPFEGAVPLDRVRRAVAEVAEIAPGCEIALCDTTGRADPFSVRARWAAILAEFGGGGLGWAFHGHDTFGMGVANALFAYEAGVRTFDAAASGLGGCPFAPNATGNVASEDLLYAFEGGGIATGIALEKLLSVADEIAALPGAQVGGHLRLVPRRRAASAA